VTLDEHKAKVTALQQQYERLVDEYNVKAEAHHRAQQVADDAFDAMDTAYHAWMDAFRERNHATDAYFAEARGEA
jgi:hypothetical protein